MRRDRSAAEYQVTLSTVHQRTVHLNKIVESLLFLAQTDSEAAKPKAESIDLTTWIPHYLTSWSGHERYASIRFESQLTGVCTVEAHSVMLAESLNVLIDNACKYSPRDSLVMVRLCQVEGQPQVQVLDRGDGISMEEERQLFEPFFRSKSTRDRGIPEIGRAHV